MSHSTSPDPLYEDPTPLDANEPAAEAESEPASEPEKAAAASRVEESVERPQEGQADADAGVPSSPTEGWSSGVTASDPVDAPGDATPEARTSSAGGTSADMAAIYAMPVAAASAAGAGRAGRQERSAARRSNNEKVTPQEAPSGKERTAAMVCAVLGVVFAIAALAVPGLASRMSSLGEPLTISGTLVACAFVLFALDVVRRGMWTLRTDVENLANETMRLDQLLHESSGLRQDVRHVNQVSVALSGEMNQVREDIVRLTKIASDPSFKSSMFRLAASQDQLAERLDVAMIKRHGELQEQVAGMVEKVDATSRETAARSQETLDLMREQHEAWEGTLRESMGTIDETFRKTAESVEGNKSSIEALEQGLRTRQKELGEALERYDETNRELARQAQEESARVAGELNDALRRAGATAAQEIEALRERLAGSEEQLSQRLASTQEQLSQRFEDAGERTQAGVKELAAELERSREALVRSVEDSNEETRQAAREAVAQLEHHQAELATAVELMGEELGNSIRGTESALEAQRATWRAAFESLGEDSSQRVREAVTSIEEALCASFGLIEERLTGGFEELAQLSRQTGPAVNDALEAQGGSIVARVQQGMAELQETLNSGLSELASASDDQGYERVVEALDQRFEERCRALSGDLMAMSELAGENFEAVQDRIASKLEGTVRERCDGISEDLMHLAELAGEANRRLAGLPPAAMADGSTGEALGTSGRGQALFAFTQASGVKSASWSDSEPEPELEPAPELEPTEAPELTNGLVSVDGPELTNELEPGGIEGAESSATEASAGLDVEEPTSTGEAASETSTNVDFSPPPALPVVKKAEEPRAATEVDEATQPAAAEETEDQDGSSTGRRGPGGWYGPFDDHDFGQGL